MKKIPGEISEEMADESEANGKPLGTSMVVPDDSRLNRTCLCESPDPETSSSFTKLGNNLLLSCFIVFMTKNPPNISREESCDDAREMATSCPTRTVELAAQKKVQREMNLQLSGLN